jgi:hypothetical protein
MADGDSLNRLQHALPSARPREVLASKEKSNIALEQQPWEQNEAFRKDKWTPSNPATFFVRIQFVNLSLLLVISTIIIIVKTCKSNFVSFLLNLNKKILTRLIINSRIIKNNIYEKLTSSS